MAKNTLQRFWANVDQSGGDDACWPWKGELGPRGFGHFTHGLSAQAYMGNSVEAPRIIWRIHHGVTAPKRELVLHKCLNILCCNPRHLYVGLLGDLPDGATRKCPVCEIVRDKKLFRGARCLPCANRLANPEERRENRYRHNTSEEQILRKRAWQESDKGKAWRKEWARNYFPSHRGAIRARYAVLAAIKTGELVRAPCEVCGAVRVHGHHDSYEPADYLKVRWLCSKHHKEHHSRYGPVPEPKEIPDTTNRGAKHPRARLCERDVIEIREIHAQRSMSLKDLAAKFFVTEGCVQNVVYRRCWKDL